MTGQRVQSLLTVLAGDFASQPIAFAALLEAAEREGCFVDLADVDVIREARETRLAHYFRPAILARIVELAGPDRTILVIRPCELTSNPQFPAPEDPFEKIGHFAGELIEPNGGIWL